MAGGKGGGSSTPSATSVAGAPAGGGQTVYTQQSPAPQFQGWYNTLANQAMQLAGRPWPGPYPGQMVAQFTPQQTQAFQEIGNVQGQFAPFVNAAGQAFGQATQPLWPSLPQYDVSGLPRAGISAMGQAPQYAAAATQAATSAPANLASFYSPFTQQVAGNLQNLFNQQNAQQLAQVAGSEVGQGAFGGDRQAVAEALTAQQQQLAQAPVLAQTLQQGFQAAQQQAAQQAALEAQTGLGAGQLNLAAGQGLMQNFAQQQQAQLAAEQANAWLASQAGFGLGNLGQLQQTLGLQGAQALGQAGLAQQQLAQEQLNIPYAEWQQMQFWPYQQLQFAAPIVEGLGSLAGGTAATGVGAPSLFNQIAGLGLSGLALAGGLGAFGGGTATPGSAGGFPGSGDAFTGANWAGSPDFSTGARGGRVGGYQAGGGVGSTDLSFTTEPSIPGLGTLPSIPDPDVRLPSLAQGTGQGTRGSSLPGQQGGGGGGGGIGGAGAAGIQSGFNIANPLQTIQALNSINQLGTGLTSGTGLLGTIGSGIGSAVSGVGSFLGDVASGIGSIFGLEQGGSVDHQQVGGGTQQQQRPQEDAFGLGAQPVGGLPRIPEIPRSLIMAMDHVGQGPGPAEFRGSGPPKAPPPPTQGQGGFDAARTLTDPSKSIPLIRSLQGVNVLPGGSSGTSASTTPGGTATAEPGSYQAGGQVDPQMAFGMTSDLLQMGGGQHPVLNSLGVRRGAQGGQLGLGDAPNGAGAPRTSLTQLGFQIPHHFRLQAGGMEAEAEASPAGATPVAGMMPGMQGAYQQMAGKSLEQLQEMAVQFPPNSPYGQIIRRVIMMKQMAPPQQAAGQERAAQLTGQLTQTPTSYLPTNFLPLESSASANLQPQPLGGGLLGGSPTAGTAGGTAQSMQAGGNVPASDASWAANMRQIMGENDPDTGRQIPLPINPLRSAIQEARFRQELQRIHPGFEEGGEADQPRNYVTADELDPHPVVDTSGQSIVVHYPSEGSSLDLGLPTSFKQHALAKYGGRIGMQAGGALEPGAREPATDLTAARNLNRIMMEPDFRGIDYPRPSASFDIREELKSKGFKGFQTGGATPPQYGQGSMAFMGLPSYAFTGLNQGYPGISGLGFNAPGRAPGFQFEPSQFGWFGAGAGYRPSPNPFAGISPVQFPDVGQATIPRPMTYANLAGPQISGSTYGLGANAPVQNPPPVPFSSLGVTPLPQNFGGNPPGIAIGGRIRLQDGGDGDAEARAVIPPEPEARAAIPAEPEARAFIPPLEEYGPPAPPPQTFAESMQQRDRQIRQAIEAAHVQEDPARTVTTATGLAQPPSAPTPSEAATRFPAGQPGRIVWSPTGGLHRAQPGETGAVTWTPGGGLHPIPPAPGAGGDQAQIQTARQLGDPPRRMLLTPLSEAALGREMGGLGTEPTAVPTSQAAPTPPPSAEPTAPTPPPPAETAGPGAPVGRDLELQRGTALAAPFPGPPPPSQAAILNQRELQRQRYLAGLGQRVTPAPTDVGQFQPAMPGQQIASLPPEGGWTPPFAPGAKPHWEQESPEFKQAFQHWWNTALTPQQQQGLGVESAFRTFQEQRDAYARKVRGEISRAAVPGTSEHEIGRAADLAGAQLAAARATLATPEAQQQYGLRFPFTDDPGHVELLDRTGRVGTAGANLNFVPENLRQPIIEAARAYNLDPVVFASMIQHESGFNPQQVTGDHVGLGQLASGTATEMGVTDRADVNQNLMGSAKYLRAMLDNPRSGGDLRTALAMYNAGPRGALNPRYADAIMGRAQQYAAITPPPGEGPPDQVVRPGAPGGGPGFAAPPAAPGGPGGPGGAMTGFAAQPREEWEPEALHRQDFFQSPWMGLLAAGATMMASPSRYPLQALGEGIMAGLKQGNTMAAENIKDVQAEYRGYAAEQRGVTAERLAGLKEASLAEKAANDVSRLELQRQHLEDVARYQGDSIAVRAQLAANASELGMAKLQLATAEHDRKLSDDRRKKEQGYKMVVGRDGYYYRQNPDNPSELISMGVMAPAKSAGSGIVEVANALMTDPNDPNRPKTLGEALQRVAQYRQNPQQFNLSIIRAAQSRAAQTADFALNPEAAVLQAQHEIEAELAAMQAAAQPQQAGAPAVPGQAGAPAAGQQARAPTAGQPAAPQRPAWAPSDAQPGEGSMAGRWFRQKPDGTWAEVTQAAAGP